MKAFFAIVIICCSAVLSAQTDTAHHAHNKHKFLVGNDSSFVFHKSTYSDPSDSVDQPNLSIGGYISTYYAHYDDEITNGEFVQFPTICPRNNQFSLNMAMLSLRYTRSFLRSNLTFHYGDIPQSAWPAEFNLIQEANVGFKIVKHLWLDAGFFKTHIGIESFQPRENITSSMAILSFYEPYYLSGAKLTYSPNHKWNFMVGAFNGYNEYVDNNKDKMLCFTAAYHPVNGLSLTYNFLTCDETPDGAPIKKRRFYNNFYASLNGKTWQAGIELNYGYQMNSLLTDNSQPASMSSALAVAHWQFAKKVAVYGRYEYFADPNKILSFDNNIGAYLYGVTGGFEIKPYKNISVSLESRMLHSDNLIFKQGSFYTNQRLEFIACVDLWF
jgi:hypothetical protein